MMTSHGQTAAARGLACCHLCRELSPVSCDRCGLCGASLHPRLPRSLQRTLSFLATAVILYIPANVLPIMHNEILGSGTDSTILGGVVTLVEHGSYPIAAVIFVASVMVPVGKLLALSWLCWIVARGDAGARRERTRVFRATEVVGKWSMTDVFVVAILVALIQLGGLMSIRPGPAAVAFGGVVVATMLAAESFDPRLIWDRTEEADAER